jgi:hypothetical protein
MNPTEIDWKELYETLLDAASECRRRQTLYRMPRNLVNRRLVEDAERKLDDLVAHHVEPTTSSSSPNPAPPSSSSAGS